MMFILTVFLVHLVWTFDNLAANVIEPIFQKEFDGQISIKLYADGIHTKLELQVLQVQPELSVVTQEYNRFNCNVYKVPQCHYKAKITGKFPSSGIISICGQDSDPSDGETILFDGIIEVEEKFLLFYAFNNTQNIENAPKPANYSWDEKSTATDLSSIKIREVKVVENFVFTEGFNRNIVNIINYAVRSTLTQNFVLASSGIEKVLVELEILAASHSVNISSYINKALFDFKDHVRNVTLIRTPHDASYYWSGAHFEDKAGVSFRESLLFSDISVAVISVDANDALNCASIELHELLHMIGVSHDNGTNDYVMSMRTDEYDVPRFSLSKGSKKQLKKNLPYLAKHLHQHYGKTSEDFPKNEPSSERDVCDADGRCVCKNWWYFGQQCKWSLFLFLCVGIVIISLTIISGYWIRRKPKSGFHRFDRNEDMNFEMDQGTYGMWEM